MKNLENKKLPSLPAILKIDFLDRRINPTRAERRVFSGMRCELAIVQHLIEEMQKHVKEVIFTESIEDIKSNILNNTVFMTLMLLLPRRFRGHKWKVLYTSDIDGVTLNTLFERWATANSVIIAIKTDYGVFGAFISADFALNRGFIGTGESFVFSLDHHTHIYTWNQTNNLILAANSDDIMIGGPRPAIWLDRYMQHGFSEPCETFGSPCLASNHRFRVEKVELLGVARSQSDA